MTYDKDFEFPDEIDNNVEIDIDSDDIWDIDFSDFSDDGEI